MKRLFIFPRAEQDLDGLAEYIAKDNIDAALGLYNAADSAFSDSQRCRTLEQSVSF